MDLAIAEINRALLLIDHHLRWIEKDLDLEMANKVNNLIQSTSENSERVRKKCRILLCDTCNEILKMRPEMDRQTIHEWHKRERMVYEYKNSSCKQ